MGRINISMNQYFPITELVAVGNEKLTSQFEWVILFRTLQRHMAMAKNGKEIFNVK